MNYLRVSFFLLLLQVCSNVKVYKKLIVSLIFVVSFKYMREKQRRIVTITLNKCQMILSKCVPFKMCDYLGQYCMLHKRINPILIQWPRGGWGTGQRGVEGLVQTLTLSNFEVQHVTKIFSLSAKRRHYFPEQLPCSQVLVLKNRFYSFWE